MGSLSSNEKGGSSTLNSPESKAVVFQPRQQKQIESILSTLETIENLGQKFSEQTGEDRSADMGATGAGAAGTAMSARAIAIANLPDLPIMQKELEKHIRSEVKRLSREAKRIASVGRPGAAFYLNELYSRIRRLNGLLWELLEASMDLVKRLFIRVFVDKQQII